MKYNAAFSTRKKSYLAKVTINGIETKGMNSFIDADSLEDNTLRVIQSARTDEGKFMGRPVFLGDYKIYDPARFTATQRKVNVVVKDRYGETHTYKITITALSIGEELEFWERHVPENIEIAYKKEL
jgi:hypothetical protein